MYQSRARSRRNDAVRAARTRRYRRRRRFAVDFHDRHRHRRSLDRRPADESHPILPTFETPARVRAGLPGRRRRRGPRRRLPARPPRRGRHPAVDRAVLADASAGRRVDRQHRLQRIVRRRRGGGAHSRRGTSPGPTRTATRDRQPIDLLPGHRAGHGLGRRRPGFQSRVERRRARHRSNPVTPGDRDIPRRSSPVHRRHRPLDRASGRAESGSGDRRWSRSEPQRVAPEPREPGARGERVIGVGAVHPPRNAGRESATGRGARPNDRDGAGFLRRAGAAAMVTQILFVGIVLALAAQRLLELRLSRRNEARILAQGGCEHAPEHFAAMKILHTTWFLAMIVEVVWLDRPFLPLLSLGALMVLTIGQSLRYAAIRALGWRWTVRIMTLPDMPPITHGIYHYLRHPNYLGD